MEVIAKDFIFFIDRKCYVNKDGNLSLGYIKGIDINNNKVLCNNDWCEPKDIFPILKMLENISVEDTVYISCDIMNYDRETDEIHKNWNENDRRDIAQHGMIQFCTQDSIYMPVIMTYLIKCGYNLHLLNDYQYLEYDSKTGVLDFTKILNKYNVTVKEKELI